MCVCVFGDGGGGGGRGGETSFYFFTVLCEKGITKLILPLNNFTVVVVAMVVVGGRAMITSLVTLDIPLTDEDRHHSAASVLFDAYAFNNQSRVSSFSDPNKDRS